MHRRVKKLWNLVSPQLDGLLITSPENVRYLSGFSGTEGTLLLTRKEGFFLTDGRYTTQAREQISNFTIITFKEKWKDNSLMMQGLEEIGSNPFPATLNIKAKEPSQYAGIATFLDSKSATSQPGLNIIDKVNYNQNKLVIDRLGRIIPAVEKSGSIIAIIFVIVAIII
ncbi:MAG: aminopeptidase P family N-terminal domain-containing protein, partial [Pseudomonadota bacterium]